MWQQPQLLRLATPTNNESLATSSDNTRAIEAMQVRICVPARMILKPRFQVNMPFDSLLKHVKCKTRIIPSCWKTCMPSRVIQILIFSRKELSCGKPISIAARHTKVKQLSPGHSPHARNLTCNTAAACNFCSQFLQLLQDR